MLIIYIIIALLGISLELWAYCRKHPVLLLVFFFISIVAIAFFSHFNSQKVGNFISELQTKTRAEARGFRSGFMPKQIISLRGSLFQRKRGSQPLPRAWSSNNPEWYHIR